MDVKRVWSGLFVMMALVAVTLAMPAVGEAKADPAKAACIGYGYQKVQRTDGTSFKNPGECIKYVAAGGALTAAPSMVIDVYYVDDDHCEFTVALAGFPASTSVPVSIDHPAGGLQTLYAQIGTDGTTNNGTGGYGVGFSIPIDQTITVTVGSPAVLTQDVLC